MTGHPTPTSAGVGPGSDGTPFGRYRLLSPLGHGGSGVVWKAYDTSLRRVFALRQILPEDAGGPECVQRFLAEARHASKLRHPHILSVHEVGEIDGRAYVTVEFVEGRTFLAYLEGVHGAKPPRPPADLLRHEIAILAHVAEAVAHAHSEGITHRALKASNILLDRKDRPYLMDFGFTRKLGTEAGPPPPAIVRRLAGGPVLGTPDFLSPEQAIGDGARIGPRSDLWALGVILYEVLAGRLPFHASTPWATIAAILDIDPPAIGRDHRPVPEDLEALCGYLLQKDPEQRPARAAEVAEDLVHWLRGEPLRARRPGLLTRWSKRLGF